MEVKPCISIIRSTTLRRMSTIFPIEWVKNCLLIEEDRSESRSRTYSKPMPPSDPKRFHGSKDENYITQKDTQPSQTCSGGFIRINFYAICFCFFAIREYNLICII